MRHMFDEKLKKSGIHDNEENEANSLEARLQNLRQGIYGAQHLDVKKDDPIENGSIEHRATNASTLHVTHSQ